MIFNDPKHPEFQYQKSRNPYFSKNEKNECGLILQDHGAEGFRGDWKRGVFNNPNSELVLEIGSGTGEFLIDSAEADQTKCFIALEQKYKQVYKMAQKANKRGLQNIRFVRGYGERVQQLFGPRELQGVYILFPDPWPKKAQRKHRMIEPRFLRKLYEVLADGGSLHIRTDDSSYFNWILNSFQSVKDCFRIEGLSWNLYEQEFFADLSVRSLQKTLFEKIWIDEGKSIHALTAKKLING